MAIALPPQRDNLYPVNIDMGRVGRGGAFLPPTFERMCLHAALYLTNIDNKIVIGFLIYDYHRREVVFALYFGLSLAACCFMSSTGPSPSSPYISYY